MYTFGVISFFSVNSAIYMYIIHSQGWCYLIAANKHILVLVSQSSHFKECHEKKAKHYSVEKCYKISPKYPTPPIVFIQRHCVGTPRCIIIALTNMTANLTH